MVPECLEPLGDCAQGDALSAPKASKTKRSRVQGYQSLGLQYTSNYKRPGFRIIAQIIVGTGARFGMYS